MYLYIKTKSNIFFTKYSLYIDTWNSPNYYADGFTSEEQINLAISQIEGVKERAKIGAIGTPYYTLSTIHDWIIDNMEYDLESSNRSTVYGALIQKRGVCEAYARTYKYILDDYGIENILVTGTGTNSRGETEDHMWNYVKLNGEWYAVDVTWDDPIVIGGGTVSREAKRRYFLIGSSEFLKSHTENFTISTSGRIFTIPKLSVLNYN